MSAVFGRLAPFIKEYIYAQKWDELREIQVEACKVIFDTKSHLILASGTASGKTEAAFLPVLTEVLADPPSSIAVLYVAPIKALINDQFARLDDLLREAGIAVWHWHGDVTPTHKRRMLSNPSGVLQITPESLEGMLLNKGGELVRLFGDLRFVIIDEVHNFMGSDRGMQVLCQLDRLRWHTKAEPRRIGLSATLGDCSLAERWLAAGTGVPVVTAAAGVGNRSVRLAVEHFYESQPSQGASDRRGQGAPAAGPPCPYGRAPAAHADAPQAGSMGSAGSAGPSGTAEAGGAGRPSISDGIWEGGADPAKDPDDPNEQYERASAFWEYLYGRSLGKKCIIFVNLRNDAELVIATLRQMADLRGTPDIYHVHHGSIAAVLREGAERDMKEGLGPSVISATLTLEMGIDIGRLESIFQVNAPNSVSSFLQRLGRSGRRGNAAEMWFLCKEEQPSGVPLPPQQIPWRLLQTIAVLQLYLEDRWVESPFAVSQPLSLLYHQTMSVVSSYGEIAPEALAGRVLAMAPFAAVDPGDYADLIGHLISIVHLQTMEDGGVIVGLEGERQTNSHRFLAVFADDENEYVIVADSKPIGKIENPPPPGERVTLAGRTWEVTEVDAKRKVVFARRVRGKVRTYWKGGGYKVDGRILSKMREVLRSADLYPYLQKGARARLDQARFICSRSGMADMEVASLGGDTICVMPWMGTVDFRTLLYVVRKYMGHVADAKTVGGWTPYFMTMRLLSGDATGFLTELKATVRALGNLAGDMTDEDLAELKAGYEYRPPKYDAFIPPHLHKKAVARDYMDMDGIAGRVAGWGCGSLAADG
ncbi:MAG: DEAD/DEAH box helicase [Oscillospiraceae bacterium]|nr:DEAD/DEAH box helicase [Oscillospiraceae bacterium]